MICNGAGNFSIWVHRYTRYRRYGTELAPISAGAVPNGATGSQAVGSSAGPIRVGFIYANNDAASAAGVNNNMTVTAEKAMKALVASYNENAGFAGRKSQA